MGSAFSIVLGLLFVASGAGIGFISYQAATGALGRNRSRGIRIASTLESDESWRAGHRAALVPSLLAAGQMALCGLVLLFTSGDDTAKLIVLASSALLVTGMAVATLLANQAAHRANDGTNDRANEQANDVGDGTLP